MKMKEIEVFKNIETQQWIATHLIETDDLNC